MAVRNYSNQQIWSLARKADKDNTVELKLLQSMTRELVQRANKRLYRLEKAGETGFVYGTIQGFLKSQYGTKRFVVNQKLLNSPIKMAEQLYRINMFLNSATSTAKGQRAAKKKILDTWEKKLDARGIKFNDKTRDSFLKFLGSQSFKDIAEKLGRKTYGYNEILDWVEDNFQDTDKMDEFIEAADKYVSGEIMYDELFEILGLEV